MDKEKVQSGLLQASVAGAMIAIDLSTTGGLGTLMGAIGGGVMSNQVGGVLEKVPGLIRKKLLGNPDAVYQRPFIATYTSAILQALGELEKEFRASGFTSQEKKEVRKLIYDTEKQVKDLKSIDLDSLHQLSIGYGDLTPSQLESTFQSQISQVIEEWRKDENLSENFLGFVTATLPRRLNEKLNALLLKNPQIRQDLTEYYLETLVELNEQNSGVFSGLLQHLIENGEALLEESSFHSELLRSLIRKVVDNSTGIQKIVSKVSEATLEVNEIREATSRIEHTQERQEAILKDLLGEKILGDLLTYEFIQEKLKGKEKIEDRIKENFQEEERINQLLLSADGDHFNYLSESLERVKESRQDLASKQVQLSIEIENYLMKVRDILPFLKKLNDQKIESQIQSLIEKGEFEKASGLLTLEDLEKKSQDLANEYFLKGKLEIGALGNDPERFDKCRHYFDKALEISDTYELNIEFGHFLRAFGQLEEARERYEKAAELAKSRLEYFEAMTELLSLLSTFGSSEDEVLFTKGIEECRKEAELDSSLVSELSNFLSSYGIFLGENKREQEALPFLKEALELSEQGVDRNNTRDLIKLAARYHNLAEKLHRVGDLAGSKDHFQKALKIYRQLDSNDPDNIVIERRLAGTFDSYASLLKDLREYMLSELYYREAIKNRKPLANSFPQFDLDSLANSFSNFGQFLGEQGLYWEAKHNLHKAVSIRNRIIANLGANPHSLARLALSEITMGWVLIHEKSKLAIGYLDAAYRNFTEASKHHSPSFLVNVANAHRHLGMYSASVEPDRVLAINHFIEAGGIIYWLNRKNSGDKNFRTLILSESIKFLKKLEVSEAEANAKFIEWVNRRDNL